MDIIKQETEINLQQTVANSTSSDFNPGRRTRQHHIIHPHARVNHDHAAPVNKIHVSYLTYHVGMVSYLHLTGMPAHTTTDITIGIRETLHLDAEWVVCSQVTLENAADP